MNNRIPEAKGPFVPIPTVDEKVLVENNEVFVQGAPKQDLDNHSNVLMTHAGDDSLFNNTEVLAGEDTLLLMKFV